MGRRYDCPAVWWSNVYFDRLGIIRWDIGLLTSMHILEWVKPFFGARKTHLQICSRNPTIFNIIRWDNGSMERSSCCLTEIFPIYQNKHWTIKHRDDCSGDPTSHRIISKIVRLLKTSVTCKPRVKSSILSEGNIFPFLTLIITLKFFVLKEKHYYFYFMCVL